MMYNRNIYESPFLETPAEELSELSLSYSMDETQVNWWHTICLLEVFTGSIASHPHRNVQRVTRHVPRRRVPLTNNDQQRCVTNGERKESEDLKERDGKSEPDLNKRTETDWWDCCSVEEPVCVQVPFRLTGWTGWKTLAGTLSRVDGLIAYTICFMILVSY